MIIQTNRAVGICCLILLILASLSCGDKENQIPDVYVDFTINVNSTEYLELNTVGGWVYVTGGYRGILLYRASIDEFMAYDRACTYDPHADCARIKVEESGIIAGDTCCGSRFILLDGSPLKEVPARLPLKRYATYYDGLNLHVYN
jgi:nitrite reductase/ring-hydroxylating ferredoxin subunit